MKTAQDRLQLYADKIVDLGREKSELLAVLKKTVSELKDWRDHWNNEADSFNHPSQEQEYGMCKDKAESLTEQIKEIESLIQKATRAN